MPLTFLAKIPSREKTESALLHFFLQSPKFCQIHGTLCMWMIAVPANSDVYSYCISLLPYLAAFNFQVNLVLSNKMLNSLKEELTHVCNPFVLRHVTFLSVIHVSKHLPRTLWWLCLLAPGVVQGILSAGPWHTWYGHFWTMLYTEYISSTTHPLLQILKTKTKRAIGTMENYQRIAMNLYLKPVLSAALYSSYVFSLHMLQTLHKDHWNKWKSFTSEDL